MNTIWNLLVQSTTVIILGLGMTVVIATGGIDISVGSVMALSGIIVAQFVSINQIPLAIIASLGVVALSGAFVGILVAKLKIQPMIISLSMLYVLRGIAKLLSGGRFINYNNPGFSDIAYLKVWDIIPVQVFIIIALTLFLLILLRKTRFGVYIEAYGDNPLATKISGVKVVLVIVLAYVICEIFAGMAGIMETALITSADPTNMGLTKEMDAIAVTVIGGTPIIGGRPNVLGTVCGALILQLITVMVNMNNIPFAFSLVLKAGIIVAAIYIQKLSKNKK
jgi:Ribose/xylose/arabinose/galactoside ABC-type transport systems, permease components